MAKFKPDEGTAQTTSRIYVDADVELRERIAIAAIKYRLNMSDFVRQAMLYALDNMEGE